MYVYVEHHKIILLAEIAGTQLWLFYQWMTEPFSDRLIEMSAEMSVDIDSMTEYQIICFSQLNHGTISVSILHIYIAIYCTDHNCPLSE